MNKRSLKNVCCPKCRNKPMQIKEIGTVSIVYDLGKDKIIDHNLCPDTYHPTEVVAICLCGHEWKLKKCSGMNDIEEFNLYNMELQ